MRFDEASALYAEFGPFFTGMVAPVEDVLAAGAALPRPVVARPPCARCRPWAASGDWYCWSSPCSSAWSLSLAPPHRPRRRHRARPQRRPGRRRRRGRRPPVHDPRVGHRPRRATASATTTNRSRVPHHGHRRRRRGGRRGRDRRGRAVRHRGRRARHLHRRPRPRVAARGRRLHRPKDQAADPGRPATGRGSWSSTSARRRADRRAASLDRLMQLPGRGLKLRPAHRHDGGRPVAHLRHHRPDELRPRRDGRVRRPRRLVPEHRRHLWIAPRPRSSPWCSAGSSARPLDRLLWRPLRRRG